MFWQTTVVACVGIIVVSSQGLIVITNCFGQMLPIIFKIELFGSWTRARNPKAPFAQNGRASIRMFDDTVHIIKE